MKGLKIIRSYGIVIAMGVLMAVNYHILILQNNFAPAGINGIATMIQYKLNFSVGYMSLLINVPLCLAAMFVVDRDFAAKTMAFNLAFSGALLLFRYTGMLEMFVYHTENGTSTVLAPLAAGVNNGFIYAVVLRENCSLGGTSVAAAMVHEKRPELNLVWLNFAMNCVVAIASYFVYDFRLEPVLLCIIYCYLTSRVGESVIRGGKRQIRVDIVTGDYEPLCREIIEKLHHSATVLPARGMYSGRETDLVICVINPRQLTKVKEIVSHYPGSFSTVTTVGETVGNFKSVKV
ncbi:MAG: YitT family protein [Clostridia bacterium]|nr:YitT family protein [Clostridia bacterium]